ncbi:MAG TPA: hypothetical protein VIC26_02575 [Marinagarivorans sp.]
MNKIIKALICTAFLWTTLACEVMAQDGSVAGLRQQLEDRQQEVQYLEQEIGFAKQRRKASQNKLERYESDLDEKQSELKKAQLRYSGDPSSENEQFLRNAEQRVKLAELSIKSRVASVVRLETKERELTEKLEQYRTEIATLSEELHKKQLAQKVAQKTQSLRSELDNQTSLLEKRLATLQRENERLRQVAIAETEKREIAEERANVAEERARSAELALTQYHQSTSDGEQDVVADEGTLGARERARAEMARVREKLAKDTNTGTSVNLYLEGFDGTDYGMFKYLGAQQYRADAIIHDAKSRFKVAGRTYQVTVSEAGIGEEFVFLYDMTDPDKPRFVTFKKSLIDSDGVVAKE